MQSNADDTVTIKPSELAALLAQALEPIYQAIAVLQRQQADLANMQQGQQIGWTVGQGLLREQMAKNRATEDGNGNGHKPPLPGSHRWY